jgi:hypothetical protein
MKTIIDILADSLIGKTIRVYEYDSHFKHQDRRVQHYYVDNNQEVKDMYFDKNRGAWSDIKVNEIEVEIINVGGYYDPYEGSSFSIQLKDKTAYVSVTVDDKIKFV